MRDVVIRAALAVDYLLRAIAVLDRLEDFLICAHIGTSLLSVLERGLVRTRVHRTSRLAYRVRAHLSLVVVGRRRGNGLGFEVARRAVRLRNGTQSARLSFWFY